MLVASREIYKVNRKRKRINSIWVSKEEVKEYQKKTSKPINIERSYDNDGIWEKMIKKNLKKNSEE